MVNAGGGIGALELAHFVHPHARFRIVLELAFALGHFAVLGDHDALTGHRGDLAAHLGFDHSAGILRDAAFHAGGHKRCLSLEQRYRLTLHV